MKPLINTFLPLGFHSINPYLFVNNPAIMIEFIVNALFAEEKNKITDDNGIIRNVILQIGSSAIMISQAGETFPANPSLSYLFIDHVDGIYKNALYHGAESVFEPADMPYQDRQAGIKDPSGNYWWLSKRLVEEDYADRKLSTC